MIIIFIIMWEYIVFWFAYTFYCCTNGITMYISTREHEYTFELRFLMKYLDLKNGQGDT